MCGIFCSISRHGHVQPSITVQQLLNARGPDASNQICAKANGSSRFVPGAFLLLHSTVLSLRGDVTVSQPYREPQSECMLCWNGEAWKLSGERPDGNDTSRVFALLHESVKASISHMDAHTALVCTAQNVSKALSRIAGPYAFTFYDALNSRLIFGRDFLGRRSLLWSITIDGDLLLCSVADGATAENWSEVEPDGIYCVDLSMGSYSIDTLGKDFKKWGDFRVTRVPYTYHRPGHEIVDSVIPLLSLNRAVLSTSSALNEDSISVARLEQLLKESLSLRTSEVPEPLPSNVQSYGLSRAKLAILFSGGLDCTTLARLTHDLLPPSEPVDLLNVAFENPRVHKNKSLEAYELCPDRITGRASHAELSRICPSREWRFIAINIPYKETQEHRQEVIALMQPHSTEMDLSISFALYFAVRGSGLLDSSDETSCREYKTSARVLLSGLGADELFAGYTRHATAFKRKGHEGLLDELDLDLGRLGKRNLGRDDRVTSHWSREVRFPFLDEELVTWAITAPVAEKCDFGIVFDNEGGSQNSSDYIEPSKKILRCLAWKLGMKAVAKEKKRAIQFGARTAKMETGRTKGTTPLS